MATHKMLNDQFRVVKEQFHQVRLGAHLVAVHEQDTRRRQSGVGLQ